MEGSKTCQVSKLSACALGFALGITWALAVLVLGVLAWKLKFGEHWVELFSSIYVGFAATPIGVVIGILWAFVEGYISGFVIAVVYNFCLRHCKCKSCSPKETSDEVKKVEDVSK